MKHRVCRDGPLSPLPRTLGGGHPQRSGLGQAGKQLLVNRAGGPRGGRPSLPVRGGAGFCRVAMKPNPASELLTLN